MAAPRGLGGRSSDMPGDPPSLSCPEATGMQTRAEKGVTFWIYRRDGNLVTCPDEAKRNLRFSATN